MARFKLKLPTEVIKEIKSVDNRYEEIFGGMTRAGAEVANSAMRSNAPSELKSSGIMDCLKKTRTYRTPTDDGINTKVAFYGYFVNKEGKKTPAPIVCNMFEYGSSKRKYPKRPFIRKAFNKGAITAAMLRAQKELSGGLLE